MIKKYKIVIAGIGGVGGYYGGLLARAYADHEEVEINFLARGEHFKAMKEKGLKVISHTETFTTVPKNVSDNSADFGPADLVIFCCKTYDLQEMAKQCENIIHAGTVLLPLLNGVDHDLTLKKLYPQNRCLLGCTYLVSKIIAPGNIKQSGTFNALYFGDRNTYDKSLEVIQNIFEKAGINSTLDRNITKTSWQKFSFISPIATYTSAYNINIGSILKDEKHSAQLKTLMNELATLAGSLKIYLPDNIIDQNFEIMAKLPFDTTSSMQLDISTRKQSELESLTGFVATKPKEHGIQLQNYEVLYDKLKAQA
jgi:2-dehydropantoate 2-reductase